VFYSEKPNLSGKRGTEEPENQLLGMPPREKEQLIKKKGGEREMKLLGRGKDCQGGGAQHWEEVKVRSPWAHFEESLYEKKEREGRERPSKTDGGGTFKG